MSHLWLKALTQVWPDALYPASYCQTRNFNGQTLIAAHSFDVDTYGVGLLPIHNQHYIYVAACGQAAWNAPIDLI